MKKPIQFGKYFLLDRINVGGMAEVFRAKAYGVEGFERLLAVKRILPNIAEDKEFISMFIDEAKIAVQLNHANICQIFDLGKVEESYFIALEFVWGKDLRALFDRCKQRPEGGVVTMPVAQACFVIMKVCEGLDYAHNKKDAAGEEIHLVHRDVSPQNVIISYDGEVKLIDFGIAKSVGKATKTQAGILKGKFGYMSPEQVRGLPLDRRSDIFSVGIVLYELLTGERLFVGETDFSTLEKVRNVEILPPSTYNRKIPDELERIVLKALAKDVEDRYQNAIDLHDDLQAFMYTAGEFYSRKDLALWQKKTWVKEMAEEASKLEAYRLMAPPPGAGSSPSSPPPPFRGSRSTMPPPPPPPAPTGVDVMSSSPPPPPPLGRSGANGAMALSSSSRGPQVAAAGAARADLAWDEEELETHVYDTPKDASDAVVGDDIADADDISGLHEIGSGGGALDHVDLASDGAPVLAKSRNTPVNGVQPISAHPGPNGHGKSAASQQYDAILPVPQPLRPLGPSGPTLTGPAPGDLAAVPTSIRPASRASQPPFAARPRWPLLAAVGGAIVLLGGGGLTYALLAGRSGTIQISTDPPDNVRISVDDRPVHPDESGHLKLDPGLYTLSVEREGFVQWRDRVEVKSGDVVKRRAELEPLARSGFTLLSDPPGAVASLDGKELGGRTPFKVEGLLPGKHLVEVQLGGRTWSEQVTLEPGKLADLHAQLASPPPVADNRPPPPRDPAPLPSYDRAADTVVSHRPKRTPADRPLIEHPKDTSPVEPVAVRDPSPRPSRKLPSLPTDEPKDEPPAPRVEKASAGGEGFLRLGSKPWTKISVDGKDTGLATPQTHLKLGAGSHRVMLVNPQFGIKETFSVEIKAGETETVIKDLRPQGGASDGD